TPSSVWLAYALPDLQARTTIRGRLLRIREEHTEESTETWIAVDDGTAPQEVRAFLLMHNAPLELVQGCLVDVTVSPRLGHVFALSRVAELGSVVPSRRAVPAVDPLSRRLLDAIDNRTDEASPHRHAATSTLDLASIAAATGVRLSVAG